MVGSREPLDQGEGLGNLAALVSDLLLGCFKLVGRGIVFQGDLGRSQLSRLVEYDR